MESLPDPGGDELLKFYDFLDPTSVGEMEEGMLLALRQHALTADLQEAGVITAAIARAMHARRFLPEGSDFQAVPFRQVNEEGISTGAGIRMSRFVTRPDQTPYHDELVFRYAPDGSLEPVNRFSSPQALVLANAINTLAFEQQCGRLTHLSPDLTEIMQTQPAA